MTAGDRQSRWWLCGLLLAATVLSYLDRQALSLTADQLIGEYGLTQEQFGSLLAAFRYSYAAFQVAGGWLVDAFGVRVIYPAAIGLWSAAGAMTAFAPGVGHIAACRFVLGAGEAFNWPSALRTTDQLMEPADRPLANGIFNSGAALGALLAPPLVTWLTIQFGWRSAFVVTGAAGLLWIVVWQVYTRQHAARLTAGSLTVAAVPKVVFGILRKRAFWTLAVSAIVVNSASYFLADWIPLYLKRERGFSFEAGNVLSMFIYGGLDLGNLMAGLYVRKLTAFGWGVPEARNSALMFSCVLMSAAALAGITSGRYLTVALLVVTAIGVTGFLVIYLTLVQEVDPTHVGTTAGLLGGLGNLGYAIAAPFIGRLADVRETGLTFFLIGVLPWLAFLSVRMGQRGAESGRSVS